MKTTKLIVTLFTTLVMMFTAVEASAQVATNRERKKIEKHEKVLNKSMKKKAIKSARKEAKRLKKEGYMTPLGQLPMDKQIENSWQAAYEINSDGLPYYIISTQKGVATNYTAAQMQAMQQRMQQMRQAQQGGGFGEQGPGQRAGGEQGGFGGGMGFE